MGAATVDPPAADVSASLPDLDRLGGDAELGGDLVEREHACGPEPLVVRRDAAVLAQLGQRDDSEWVASERRDWYSMPSVAVSARSLSQPRTTGPGVPYQRSPSHVPCKSRRPGSRRLYAGHHLARTRAPARLIPEDTPEPPVSMPSQSFDASTAHAHPGSRQTERFWNVFLVPT
jgi:hypothetical protein